MTGALATDYVREGLYDQIVAHAAVGGVLEGVTIRREGPTPEMYAQQFSDQRGQVEMIWMGESIGDLSLRGMAGSTTLCLREVSSFTIGVQVDYAIDTGTLPTTETRARELVSYCVGIIAGDRELGIDLSTTDLSSLVVVPVRFEHFAGILAEGGTITMGHSVAYVLFVDIIATSDFTAPALP